MESKWAKHLDSQNGKNLANCFCSDEAVHIVVFFPLFGLFVCFDGYNLGQFGSYFIVN